MRNIAGIILAGGRSSRMGVEKALMDFAGRPVIAHVIERFAPQVDLVAINANGDRARFAAFDAPIIADAFTDHVGPLAGIAAGLSWARDAGFGLVAFTPCDAPFTPRDLVARLLRARGEAPIVMAQSARGLEPLFALWSIDALAPLEVALRNGASAVHSVSRALGAVIAPIESGKNVPDWALNMNNPEDVKTALAMIASR